MALRLVAGDVTDRASLERALPDGVDAVFHVAGSWARMIRMVHAGTLPGVPPGAMSYCHVREVARAHIAAAERGRRGENYLLGGVDAPIIELVRVIGEVTGRKVPDRPTPGWVLKALGRVGEWASYLTDKQPTLTSDAARMVTRQLYCDCSKAMRELGYRAVDLKTMVEDTYRWLKDEGLLEGGVRR